MAAMVVHSAAMLIGHSITDERKVTAKLSRNQYQT